MRLFVALPPPADALAEVDAAVDQARGLQPDLRWIPCERWHLTLAFYGEIPDESLEGVVDMVGDRLSRSGVGAPFELFFAGAGQFSRRALWVGIDGDLGRLSALARAVNTDRRPYRPHLTVARLRGGQDGGPAAGRLASYVGPTWRAEEVRLVRSYLGPKPRYETVGRWPLVAAGSDG